jgi:thioredoxin reductase
MTTSDVLVIGGGVAGLSAALTLGRARRSVVVVDTGHPRNEPAGHSHGFLTRDGASPLELTRIGREEVSAYGVEVVAGTVTAVERVDDGFRALLSDGSSRSGRRLLATAGLVDVLPEVPGLAERWGRDVVHCPYCFGWEVRDAAIGILATGPLAVEQALMWRQWTPDLIVLRHTVAYDLDRLGERGIRVVDGEVVAIETKGDRLSGVRLASGEFVAREVLVVAPRYVARHELLDDLGVTVAEHPRGIGLQVQADATGRTGVPGIWVAGNTADASLGVLQSAASGVTAAVAINADLTAAG